MTVPTAADTAPVTAPSDAPSDSGSAFALDESSSYQRWEVGPSEPTETAKAAPPTEDKAPAPTPDATQPSDDLTPEELARYEKSAAAAARIDRLAENKLGNRLPTERTRIEAEVRQAVSRDDAQWAEATATYNRLGTDDAFYDAKVAELGKPAVSEFIAKFERGIENRKIAANPRPGFDTTGYQRDFANAFHSKGVEQLQAVAKAALPFYAELPEDVRKQVEGLKPDADGFWLHDAMTALAKGVDSYVQTKQKGYEAGLREATEAGKNDAIAEREADRPVMVSGQTGALQSWQEIEAAYAEGRLPGGRAEFRKHATAHGIAI